MRTVPLMHGVGTRADLPLPLSYVVVGGAAAVLVSFVALVLLWRSPRLVGAEAGQPVPRWVSTLADAPQSRRALKTMVLALTLLVLLVALVGPLGVEDNLAPWAFHVVFWVGLVPMSLVLGPVWAVANPLRTMRSGIARLVGGDSAAGLPRTWGYWPAAVLFGAFSWFELVAPDRAEPPVLGAVLLAYVIAQVAAATYFGERWLRTGEPFEVYARLLGRLAPIGRRRDGVLVWRSPLNGADSLEPLPGLAAVAVILIGSTAYDGVSRTSWWQNGPGLGEAVVVTGTVGLVATIAVVSALFAGACAIAGRLGGYTGATAVFAHSLLPIAAGYAIAHYFSLLVFDGQAAFILASDPFGTGADILGIRTRAIDYTVVSARTIALVQVTAIVVGHVVGVVLAHDRATRLDQQVRLTQTARAPRSANVSQIPLLIIMIAFTVGGLFILLGG
ncbi:MAG: hypothetical protein HY830_03100 [Actinobacteria bacterium]|nr:hypothetical protein [Actinomycetota bacterium]